MKNKIILILSTYLLVIQMTNAQTQSNNTMFNLNPTYYNPAFSGMQESGLNFCLNSRANWIAAKSIIGNNYPWNALASIDKRLDDKNIGVSLNFANNNFARINSTEISGNFAYHINLFRETKFSMGIKAGFNYLNIGDIYLENSSDYQFNDVGNFIIPKFGIGLLYKSESFWMGAASPDMFTYDKQGVLAASNSTFKRLVININAGYKLMLNADFYFQPSVLYIVNPILTDKLDINLAFGKNEIYWAGVGYSPQNNYSVMGVLNIKNRYKFSYSLSYNTAFGDSDIFSTSHEISLNWDLEDVL